MAKIFEKVIQSRINKHLHSLDHLFTGQFGFRSKIGTCHALGWFQKDVNIGLNDGKATTLVNLDLKAAFDSIWHEGLLFKMRTLGFNDNLLKMTSSFLANRSFVVRLNEFCSQRMDMPRGVPQGSVLSPTLFNIYVHDLPRHEQIKTLQFADDTSFYLTYNDARNAQDLINTYMVRLTKFFSKWKLVLNAQKTSLLHVVGSLQDTTPGFRRQIKRMKIVLKGQLIAPDYSVCIFQQIINFSSILN